LRALPRDRLDHRARARRDARVSDGEDERAERRELLDGALPVAANELDGASERGDRRVHAGWIAVEDALPSHRVLADVVVARFRRDGARDRDAERGRAAEAA